MIDRNPSDGDVEREAEAYVASASKRAIRTCRDVALVLGRPEHPLLLIDPFLALDEEARELATIVACREQAPAATNHPARDVADLPPRPSSSTACPGGDFTDGTAYREDRCDERSCFPAYPCDLSPNAWKWLALIVAAVAIVAAAISWGIR